MQTTIDCTKPSVPIRVEVRNYTDEHINYLFASSPEGLINHQIEKKLEEEENELKEIKEEFEYLQQFKDFRPQPKPQEYVRVGKRCKN